MPTDADRGQHVGPAARYAVVFTTYAWDGFVEAMYERNAARVRSGDMHVVADETGGPVAVPAGLRKTVAAPSTAAALGLRIAYHRALFWHNIDYLYYIFFDRHPDYDYYVFLDYDAYVDMDVDRLITDVVRCGVDYVGAPVDGAIEDWTFARQHDATYGPGVLEARISAVTILSRRALAHLYRRRREMSAAPTPAQQAFWPICEAFVPCEVKLAGLVAAGLRDFGDVTRFAWWPPTLDEHLTPSPAPAFVHPVLDRPRFIQSMLKNARTRDFVRPRHRLWRAIGACRDRRWAAPMAAELLRRLLRLAKAQKARDAAAVTVGMRWDD